MNFAAIYSEYSNSIDHGEQFKVFSSRGWTIVLAIISFESLNYDLIEVSRKYKGVSDVHKVRWRWYTMRCTVEHRSQNAASIIIKNSSYGECPFNRRDSIIVHNNTDTEKMFQCPPIMKQQYLQTHNISPWK